MTDPRDAHWRKSRLSGNNGGNCVEVASLHDDSFGVRDSKLPDAGHLDLTRRAWGNFLTGVKSGRYDLPA